MHAVTGMIVKLVEGLPALDGDKPAMHARAKELVTLAQYLVKVNQPGAGDFKWSAKARKELTKSANARKGNPTLMIARGESPLDVWHTNEYYLVKGEPSQRFAPYDTQDLPLASVESIISGDRGEEVTIVGTSDKVSDVDCVELSNGTVVNRTLITYVMQTIGGVTRLYNKGPLYPVHVGTSHGTYGLVMPIRVK